MTISTRSRSRAESQSSPNKRQKIEEQASNSAVQQPAPEPRPDVGERHASLWFDDGNVIIVARKKSFRVHSGLLAHHSDAFKELLSATALASLSERLDGCPILRTEGDGNTLAQLLQIIYDGCRSDWSRPTQNRVPFSDFRLVVLAAAKYRVTGVLEAAAAQLAEHYPTCLKSWVKLQAQGTLLSGTRPSLALRAADAIAAVELCRLVGAPAAAHVALYACCVLEDPAPLVRGVECGGEVVRLSDADAARVLAARSRIVQENVKALRIFLEFENNIESLDCRTTQACRFAAEDMALRAIKRKFVSEGDPLQGWYFELVQEARDKGTLCVHCDMTLRRTFYERRESVWKNLPKILGVETVPAEKSSIEGVQAKQPS